MTNILLLPQLQATFIIANNAEWNDQIKFLQEDGETPLSLEGITFRGQMRPTADSPVVTLDIGSFDNTITNGGETGLLGWNVTKAQMNGIEAGQYVFDLLAFGDYHIVNLFEKAGAATVIVNEGVTKVADES